jgi:hypothetical protein
MTSANPPSPYFNGITYNPSFFSSSSSSSGISLGVANSLYLRKTIQDTATSLETFSGGINTTTIKAYNYDAINSSSSIVIGAGQTGGGTLGLGTGATRTGPIYVGNNVVPISMSGPLSMIGTSLSMSAGATATILGNPLNLQGGGNINMTSYNDTAIEATAGGITIGSALTTGTINIGTGARNQNINIGTGATGGKLYLGSSNMPVSILGTFTLASVGTTGPITGASVGTTGPITGASFTNTATSGSIGSTGAITGTSLALGTGAITSGAITSTGAITGTGFTGTSLTLGTGAISTVGNITSTGDIKTTTGKLIAGTIDAVSDAAGVTALKIGSNVILGDIEIGNSQTTGDIKIGLSDTSGATITIGTSSTATTINGTLTTTGAISTSGNISTTGTGTITTASTGSIKTDTIDSTVSTNALSIGGTIATSTTNGISLGGNCLIKVKSPALTNTGSTPSTQASTTTTLYGGLMYSNVTTTYTIPASGTINRDFYIVAGGGVNYTITMPAVSIHQVIHIRNENSGTINITAPLVGTKFYPNQTGGGVSTTTYVMPANTVQNFYCDGVDWQGF